MRLGKKGLTLIELVVSGSMIAVILIGVVSFNVSIKGVQDTTFKSSALAMRTMGAMSYLVQDASMVTGDRQDPGIFTRNDSPSTTYRDLCFRHDQIDPNVYTDDAYVCYVLGAGDILQRIDLDSVGVWPPAGKVSSLCNVTTNPCTTLDLLVLSDIEYFDLSYDVDGRLEYIEIRVETIFDPSIVSHDMSNPKYILSTRVNPMAHSR